jgi:hypothetical protein
MEIALLSTLLSKTFRDVTAEGFRNMVSGGRKGSVELFTTTTPAKKESKSWIWILVLVIWGISSLVGIYSAYLSWKTNTLFDMPTGQKVIFAICAFLGGILYLILYYAFRYSDVQYIRNMKGLISEKSSITPVTEPVEPIEPVGPIEPVDPPKQDDRYEQFEPIKPIETIEPDVKSRIEQVSDVQQRSRGGKKVRRP